MGSSRMLLLRGKHCPRVFGSIPVETICMEMVLLSLMAETPRTGDVLGATKTGQPGKPTLIVLTTSRGFASIPMSEVGAHSIC